MTEKQQLPDGALTWDELAALIDATRSGRRARTLPMDEVFKWAEAQTDKFIVSKDGTIHRRQL